MGFDKFNIITKKLDKDYLRLNIRKKEIKCGLSFFRYRDKDTRQIVIFVPALDMTSYGATEEKAQEMMKFSMEEYSHYLTNLPAKKIELELTGLGWKHNALRNKEYSKAYVDISGELKNFNAVADKVERLTLVA